MLQPASRARSYATAAAAATFASTTLVAVLGASGRGASYPDFIVGYLAWIGGSKLGDLAAMPLALVVAIATFAATDRLFDRLAISAEGKELEAFATAVVVSTLPLAVGIGGYFARESTDPLWFWSSSAAVATLLGRGIRAARRREAVDADEASSAALFVVASTMMPLAVALVMRVLGRSSEETARASFDALPGVLFGAFVLQSVASFRRPGWLDGHRTLVALQCLLPLLFLSLIPAPIVDASGHRVPVERSPFFLGLAGALILAAYVEFALQVAASRRSGPSRRVIAPTAAFAVVVLLRAGVTTAPAVPPDDYHFGEQLVGAFRMVEHGDIPYVDHMPPHGILEDDVASMISYALFDGSAAAHDEGARLLFVLLAFVAFRATFHFSGSLLLAFTSTVLSGGRLAWLFFSPFVAAWLGTADATRHLRYVVVFAVTAPIVVLGIPPQGVLLVAVFAPLALRHLWLALQTDRRTAMTVASTIVILALGVVLSPLGAPVRGAIAYVLSNGSVNQVAYGIPWSESRGAGRMSGLAWELLRNAWVVAPLLAASVGLRHRSNIPVVLSSFALFALSLLLVPYTMGRIDWGSISRAGTYTIWALGFLAPLLLARVESEPAEWHAPLVGLAFVVLCLGPPVELATVHAAIRPRIDIGTVRDARSAGLPGVGVAALDAAHFERLSRLAAEIRPALDGARSYLDLTSRSAHHAYLRLAPVVPTPAPYNLAARSHQEDAVRAIERARPALALLSAENVLFDGGTLALRDPIVFRYVVDRYTPYADGPFVFGRRFDRRPGQEVGLDPVTDAEWDRGVARRRAAIRLSDPTLAALVGTGDRVVFLDGTKRTVVAAPTGAELPLDGPPLDAAAVGAPHNVHVLVDDGRRESYRNALLTRVYANPDLRMVPSSWGHSWGALERRMQRVLDLASAPVELHDIESVEGELRAIGADPYLAYDVGGRSLAGRDAGLLRFHLRCHGVSVPQRMQVFFWGDGERPTEANSIRITAAPGTLIVPLDSHPRYARMGRVEGIRLDFDGEITCQRPRLSKASLNRRL